MARRSSSTDAPTQPVPISGVPAVRAEPPNAPVRLPRGFRTLRWRLAVFYIATLAALVLVMGVALNVVIGRVLFAEELTSFQAQSRLTVARQLTRFDTL
ncbi:MAG TPA: hypothetical protein VGR57_06860, partial [Ktedonobacterales bacterium]|nr:hypothetical protein [Ktedonobacterales bacterium]